MAQMGFYGQAVTQYFHLEHQPSSLITRSLRNAEISVTEILDDTPVEGPSGEMDLQDAYVVGLKLYDYPNAERWECGKPAAKTDIRAGATHLYDMKKNPRFIINQPLHFLNFYLPRSALDGIAEQASAPRVAELPSQLGDGHDDPVIRHIGGVILQALRRPAETNRLFIDYTMLAFTAHVAQTYGGLRTSERWPAAVSLHGRRNKPAKGSTPISVEHFRCSRSRPSLASRSAISHARFASQPACRRTNGCFASA
jgi:hypothetical protein